MSKTLREALADLLEARATLACMVQPQLVALDRAVERIEAALADQAQAEPVAWRPLLKGRPAHLPPADFTAGKPDQRTLDYWASQGVEVEYAYTAPQPAAQPVAEDPPQWLPPSLFGAWDRMQGQRVEAQEQPMAVPDGYALVPVEPTPEMVKAGTGWGTAHSTWGAMLSAFPKVPR